MVSTNRNWGFYGRKNELARLVTWMTASGFSAFGVIGGRGVGKTTLIEHAEKQLHGRKPFVYLELPAIRSHDSDVEVNRVELNLYESLLTRLGSQGLVEEIKRILGTNCARFMPGIDVAKLDRPLQREDLLGYPPILATLHGVEALLKLGAVVVLDEFQNAENLGILSLVKSTIDGFKTKRFNPSEGKAVLAGSHQQKMLTIMYDPESVMYGRISGHVRIFPLPAPALFEMAVDRGWIGHPARFLTAYVAFGGIPRLWELLATAQNREEIMEPVDGSDESWRRRFIRWRIEMLVDDPGETYFQKAYMSLSKDAAELFAHLAKNPNGVPWSEVVDFFNPGGKLRDEDRRRGVAAYRVLGRHLGIADFIDPPIGDANRAISKVRITEHAALFEEIIMPNFFSGGETWMSPIPAKAMSVLNHREGFALERLAKEYFEDAEGIDQAFSDVECTIPDEEELEIDVVAETDSEASANERKIVLCSCKRSAHKHDVSDTMKQFNRYLNLRRSDGGSWADQNVFRYLVSPDWGGHKIQSSEVRCLDFADMASSSSHEWERPVPANSN